MPKPIAPSPRFKMLAAKMQAIQVKVTKRGDMKEEECKCEETEDGGLCVACLEWKDRNGPQE